MRRGRRFVAVFPAHAGMNQFTAKGLGRGFSVPRARGDEPERCRAMMIKRHRSIGLPSSLSYCLAGALRLLLRAPGLLPPSLYDLSDKISTSTGHT